MAKQYLEMLEDIYDPETKIKFIKGLKYTITYEADDAYYLGKQDKTPVGISKFEEGRLYRIGTVKTPRPSK